MQKQAPDIDAPRRIAVLTGDIVGSARASPEDLAGSMAEISAAAADIACWQTDRPDPRFTRFRGDGWQFMLQDHWFALRAACAVAARLRGSEAGLSTRISIGIGNFDQIGAATLATASGAAFEHSGRGLDKMPRTRFWAIAGQRISGKDRAIVTLIEDSTRLWTPPQAEATALALHPDNPTLAEMGQVLGITKQAVGYRLSGARTTKLRLALRDWEEVEEFSTPGAFSGEAGLA